MKDRIEEWQAAIAPINARADRLQRSIHERAWKIAESVGIPRDGCCLHNASIDEGLRGWCHGNPERLRVAKIAVALLNDWTPTRIAERYSRRAWNRILGIHGYAKYDVDPVLRPRWNPFLLFRQAA